MKSLSAAGIGIGATLMIVSPLDADQWQSLKDDDLHDSTNPSISLLQEPAEALSVLRPDTAGNKVNWVAALQDGQIKPRASLEGDIEPEILDQDVVMEATLPLPYVMFAHKPHTEWMSCETCHEDLFVSETGANPINMGRILNGEYCGRCHGAVSFPLTECNRCHNVKPKSSPMAPPSGAVRDREQ